MFDLIIALQYMHTAVSAGVEADCEADFEANISFQASD